MLGQRLGSLRGVDGVALHERRPAGDENVEVARQRPGDQAFVESGREDGTFGGWHVGARILEAPTPLTIGWLERCLPPSLELLGGGV